MKWSEQCPKCGRKLHSSVACKPPRKRPSARELAERRGQDRGFGLALALCQREHDSPSVYAGVMDAYGLTLPMARAAGLEEFDLAPLRVIAKEVRSRRRR